MAYINYAFKIEISKQEKKINNESQDFPGFIYTYNIMNVREQYTTERKIK